MNTELKAELEFTKIARAIPTGMRNIDRMREDIHCTVSSVLGLIQMSPDRHLDYVSKATGNGYWWHIQNDHGRLDVACVRRRTDLPLVKAAYNGFIGKAVQMGDVLYVYQALGLFMSSMYELFPELEERLRPIVSASTVNYELFH